jgi:hypothetical protein
VDSANDTKRCYLSLDAPSEPYEPPLDTGKHEVTDHLAAGAEAIYRGAKLVSGSGQREAAVRNAPSASPDEFGRTNQLAADDEPAQVAEERILAHHETAMC